MEFGLAALDLSLQPQLQTVKRTTWFIFLLLFGVSCLDEPECYLLNNNVTGIYFRVMGSNRIDSLAVRRFMINNRLEPGELTWDIPRDCVKTFIQAPLDYFNTQTTYSFITSHHGVPGAEKQLLLGYKVQAQFVSEECGPRYILSELHVQETGFDSVRVVNADPSRDGNARNIEIFRCPFPDTVGITLHQLTLPATPGAQRSRPAGADFDAILVDGLSAFYENQRASTLHLPVNVNAESTSYEFDFAGDDPLLNGTLSVDYTRTTETRYRQCGPQTFITDLAIANTTGLDSVSIARDNNGFPFTTLTDPVQTNINIYRCPPTNLMQLGFRRVVAGGTPQTATAQIESITTDYNSEVYYEGVSTSFVQLPLNVDANSTVFTIRFTDGTEENLTVNYIVGPPSRALFRNACSNIKAITSLTAGGTTGATTVTNASVFYPPVSNVTLQIE